MNHHLNCLYSSLIELGIRLNKPDLQFDSDGRCVLNYKNKFKLEIIGLSNEKVQLHAYLINLNQIKKTSDFFYNLLVWNMNGVEFGGAYIGIHNSSEFVTLNANLTLEKINSVILQNIIENFIGEAFNVQQKIYSLLNEYKNERNRIS